MIFSSIEEALEALYAVPTEKPETKLFDSKKRKGDDPKELNDLEIKLKRKKQRLVEYYELLQYWSKIKRHKWIKEKMKQIEREIGELENGK